jgi:hypothetical protein
MDGKPTVRMAEGPNQEKAEGIQRLTELTKKDIEQIMKLPFDPLDTNNNHDTLHERRLETDPESLYRKYLNPDEPGRNGAIFVKREAGVIVAFMAVSEQSQVGHIHQLRTFGKGDAQTEAIRELLTSAETYFRKERCHNALIEAPQSSEEMKTAIKFGSLSIFFFLKKKEKAANDNSGSMAQAA